MYEGAAATWHGLLKNADEGMAAPAAILPFFRVAVFGQILPLFLFLSSPWFAAAAVLGYAARIAARCRFSQSWRGCLLHPLGVLLLLLFQWQALCLKMLREAVIWRSRSYWPHPR